MTMSQHLSAANNPGNNTNDDMMINMISTIFITGLPNDITEREFRNIFTFASGFEACCLKAAQTDNEDEHRTIGFAKFKSYPHALKAISQLNGKALDQGHSIRAELAKKDLQLKRSFPFDYNAPYFVPDYSHNNTQTPITPHIAYHHQTNTDGNNTYCSSNDDVNDFCESAIYQEALSVISENETLSPGVVGDKCPIAIMSSAKGPIKLGNMSGQISPPKTALFSFGNSGSSTPSTASIPFQPSSQAFESALYHNLNSSILLSIPPFNAINNSSSKTSSISLDYSNSGKFRHQSCSGANSLKQATGKMTDQHNPPCNTLYVGNLPPDAMEQELRDLFSAQPGYKRLCFRNKGNGPMCFVEFESVQLAAKSMQELYGAYLSNSVKGGIRLSFSKNPLGVRSITSTF